MDTLTRYAAIKVYYKATHLGLEKTVSSSKYTNMDIS